ncbi:MAG TPA: MerR family transcriptional regulator [Planctomycetota bacterium]|nr:MerR family transcriptional regulator [Planctomycetota bacterium]
MAYTVKQVAALSGVSVRALHFYDETGLLKPAYYGANGYRFYEEPQLLRLQQILFYRQLGFELKRIKRILGRADFEIVAALKSHRKVLLKNAVRTRRLIETIDKTIQHLKGTKKMKTKEMFAGFSVAAGDARFGEKITLGGEPNDCKVSSKDTDGALCVFEFNGSGGGPLHLHFDQDEWIYVIEGEFDFHVGKEQFRLRAGESVFIPRKTPHVWGGKPGKIINVYQPAGAMEDFFRAVGKPFKDLPTLEQVLNKTYTDKQVKSMKRLFAAHGMELLGPPPPAMLERALHESRCGNE